MIAAAIATVSQAPKPQRPLDSQGSQEDPDFNRSADSRPRERPHRPHRRIRNRRRRSRSGRQPPLAWSSWPPPWPWPRSARRVLSVLQRTDRPALQLTQPTNSRRYRLRRLLSTSMPPLPPSTSQTPIASAYSEPTTVCAGECGAATIEAAEIAEATVTAMIVDARRSWRSRSARPACSSRLRPEDLALRRRQQPRPTTSRPSSTAPAHPSPSFCPASPSPSTARVAKSRRTQLRRAADAEHHHPLRSGSTSSLPAGTADPLFPASLSPAIAGRKSPGPPLAVPPGHPPRFSQQLRGRSGSNAVIASETVENHPEAIRVTSSNPSPPPKSRTRHSHPRSREYEPIEASASYRVDPVAPSEFRQSAPVLEAPSSSAPEVEAPETRERSNQLTTIAPLAPSRPASMSPQLRIYTEYTPEPIAAIPEKFDWQTQTPARDRLSQLPIPTSSPQSTPPATSPPTRPLTTFHPQRRRTRRRDPRRGGLPHHSSRQLHRRDGRLRRRRDARRRCRSRHHDPRDVHRPDHPLRQMSSELEEEEDDFEEEDEDIRRSDRRRPRRCRGLR